MSEFERARERAERKAAKKQGYSMAVSQEVVEEIEPTEPVFKAPKKRSNEIAVQVWIDGNEYCFTFKTNITGTFLGTQQNQRGMQAVLIEALRTKFSHVEPV